MRDKTINFDEMQLLKKHYAYSLTSLVSLGLSALSGFTLAVSLITKSQELLYGSSALFTLSLGASAFNIKKVKKYMHQIDEHELNKIENN